MRWMALGSGRLGLTIRLVLSVLLPVAIGCAPKTAKVSGTVLYNGKPLPGGRLTFRPADPSRNSVMAELDEQGNYSTELPIGEVQVCIDNRELEPINTAPSTILPEGLSPEIKQKLKGDTKAGNASSGPPPNAPDKLPGKYVPIPEKYYTVEQSGLQFTVRGGEQKQDIELKK